MVKSLRTIHEEIKKIKQNDEKITSYGVFTEMVLRENEIARNENNLLRDMLFKNGVLTRDGAKPIQEDAYVQVKVSEEEPEIDVGEMAEDLDMEDEPDEPGPVDMEQEMNQKVGRKVPEPAKIQGKGKGLPTELLNKLKGK